MVNIVAEGSELGYIAFYVTFLLLYSFLLVPNFSGLVDSDIPDEAIEEITSLLTFPSNTFILLAIPQFIIQFLAGFLILMSISSTFLVINIIIIVMTIVLAWILFGKIIDALPF